MRSMSQPGSFATLTLTNTSADEAGRPGSFEGLRAMAGALEALFRRDGAGGDDPTSGLRVNAIEFVPAMRIEILVPRAATGIVGRIMDAIGSCLDAALDPDGIERPGDERRTAGALGVMLQAGGWEGVRIALKEDGWESRVAVVPHGAGPALARLAARRTPDD